MSDFHFQSDDSAVSSKFLTVLAVVALVLSSVAILLLSNSNSDNTATRDDVSQPTESASSIPAYLDQSELNVDFSQSDIELAKVVSGGIGKDGIPALTNPDFVAIQDAVLADDTQVMVVQINGETKIYPYSILVWHEIVNDTVGGIPVAVTFCPLCGSAIVFDRSVDGQTIEFGVSGFLYESNLLMYDRTDNESLWSQSLGRAVVGSKAGIELTRVPVQVLTYEEATSTYPGAVVLSTDTGYGRDYTSNPYAGYDESADTLFSVSVNDNRFPAKEVFYIVPLQGISVAVRQDKEDGVYPIPDTDVVVEFDKGKITALWGDAELPGYYEMWFSWATHHQTTGEVL